MKQRFSRNFDELRSIVGMTETFFSAQGLPAGMRNIVDLCVEELFVNMVTYNTETDADIEIEMRPHEHGMQVSLTDFNVERFDPRDVSPANVDAPLEERTPGGLGLYLVMKMVDSIHYEYRDRISKITIVIDRNNGHV